MRIESASKQQRKDKLLNLLDVGCRESRASRDWFASLAFSRVVVVVAASCLHMKFVSLSPSICRRWMMIVACARAYLLPCAKEINVQISPERADKNTRDEHEKCAFLKWYFPFRLPCLRSCLWFVFRFFCPEQTTTAYDLIHNTPTLLLWYTTTTACDAKTTTTTSTTK